MNRRFFVKGLLLVPVAPAICKAENLMRIVAPKDHFMFYDGTIIKLSPLPLFCSTPFQAEMDSLNSNLFEMITGQTITPGHVRWII